jgi:hypothetical protein
MHSVCLRVLFLAIKYELRMGLSCGMKRFGYGRDCSAAPDTTQSCDVHARFLGRSIARNLGTRPAFMAVELGQGSPCRYAEVGLN